MPASPRGKGADRASDLAACIAGRQVGLGAPIAGWLAIVSPLKEMNAQTQLGQALPMWGTAWLVLVGLAAVELVVFRHVQRRQLDRGRAAMIAAGVIVASVLVAAPLWWIAGAAVHPSP